MDLLENLNPPQREAVIYGGGPLLVFAGAGSGKTRVITHRLAYLVRERDVRPWQILAVTFTNKAAGEMRARVGQLLGERLRDTWIGTFHATCARLLRQFAERDGLKRDFVIYDDGDQKSMVVRCLRDLDIDERRIVPRAIQSHIEKAKQQCLSASEFEPGNFFEDQVAKVYRLYEQRMAAAGALDFSDLLYRMVRLLERDDEVRQQLLSRFRYLLVDEFQDTNHVQYRLLKNLTGPERNLCVVGDDDQSIYRWRGADVRNILNFRKDFNDAKVVLLEQNYRSSANILAGAMAVVKRNRARAPKTLWTENPPGELINVTTLEDERAESSWAVTTISKLLDGGRKPGDVAVFYRINAQARVLEEAFRSADMPYRVVGGMKFYERAEVKDLIAYLRVIFNPDDDVDLARIINRPPRKIGATTVNRLTELASREQCSLSRAVELAVGDASWPKATRSRLTSFKELMEKLRELSASAGPSQLAVEVLERTGYLDALRAENTPESDSRMENLNELVGSFELFERESDDPSMTSLLESISLQQDTDDLSEKPETITLMTVHSAKGLEFPVVVITGLEEGMFPYQRATDEVDPREERERLDEERRLCYVAMTRAREQLYLSNVARRRLFGKERYGSPSRFLGDLPEELVVTSGVKVRSSRPSISSRAGWSSPSRPASRSGPRRVDRMKSIVQQPSWAKGLSLPKGGEPKSTSETSDSADNEPRVVLEDEGLAEAFQPGSKVRHVKYGLGKIQRLESGIEPKAVVVFPGVGRKVILLRFLQPG